MIGSIRIVVTVTPANPELFSGLLDVPPRLRAERMRTLATLGLAAVSGSITTGRTNGQNDRDPIKDARGVSKRTLSIARSLGDGI